MKLTRLRMLDKLDEATRLIREVRNNIDEDSFETQHGAKALRRIVKLYEWIDEFYKE